MSPTADNIQFLRKMHGVLPLGNTLRERKLKRDMVRAAIVACGGTKTNRAIALEVNVTHGLVNKVRQEMARGGSRCALKKTRTAINGKTFGKSVEPDSATEKKPARAAKQRQLPIK